MRSGKTVNVNLKSGEDVVISDATIHEADGIRRTNYQQNMHWSRTIQIHSTQATVIEFSLPEDVSNVTLTIYNALGAKSSRTC